MNKKLISIFIIIISISFGELKIVQELSPEYPNSNYNFTAIAVSNLDEIYLSDALNNEVLSLNFSGKIINSIGGYGWDDNSMNNPSDIAINSGLNILVADKNNHRLIRYDKNLNFISKLPDENSFIEITYPIVCEITKDGILFILQENNFEILKLEYEAENYSVIGSNVDLEYQLTDPIDICLTRNQILLILESSGKILQYDIFGTPVEILSLPFDQFTPYRILSHKHKIILLSDNGEIFSQENNHWKQMLNLNSKIVAMNENGQNLFLLQKNGKILICQLSQD